MQRVNVYQLYNLATILHPLGQISAETKLLDVALTLLNSKEWLDYVLADNLMPLNVCKPAGFKLRKAIDDVLSSWQPPSDPEKKFDYASYGITTALKEFETVLSAEFQSLNTYFVEQKLAFNTKDLIENAERMFPEAVVKIQPGQAIEDIRQAGKCIVFDLPTGAGFHLMRATESVIRKYYDVVVSKKPKTRNWGKYVEDLKKKGADKKVVGLIDQIREMHRNPIMHPEVVLSMDEATTLLGIAQSAIVAIANDLQKRAGTAVPPMTVIT